MRIKLENLKVHPANARKLQIDADLVELAASIKTLGLLQPLVCTKDPDDPDGYLVIAGQRRLRAMRHLVDNGNKIADPEIVISKADPLHVSVAENVARLPMRPVDQFRAFMSMGIDRPAAEIAEQFGISELLVQRRMRLGKLIPQALNRLETEDVSLKYAMILTLCSNAKHQKEMMRQFPEDWQAHTMRRTLLDEKFPVSSVAFDIEKYTGHRTRDLFASDEGTDEYLTDMKQAINLQTKAATAAAELLVDPGGWKWAEFKEGQWHDIQSKSKEHFQTVVPDRNLYTHTKHRYTKAEKARLGVIICFGNQWTIETHYGVLSQSDARQYKKEEKTAEVINAKEEEAPKRGDSGTYSMTMRQDIGDMTCRLLSLHIAWDPELALSVLLTDLISFYDKTLTVSAHSHRDETPHWHQDFDLSWVGKQFEDTTASKTRAQTVRGFVKHMGLEGRDEWSWCQIFDSIEKLRPKQKMNLLALFIGQYFQTRKGPAFDAIKKKTEMNIRKEWYPTYEFWSRFNRPQMERVLETLGTPPAMVKYYMSKKVDDCRHLMVDLFCDPTAMSNSQHGNWFVNLDAKDRTTFIKAVKNWVSDLWTEKED